MKYLLIVKGDTDEGTRVTICDTEQERNRLTVEAIFGERDLPPEKDQEAVICLSELNENGKIEFEGDPPLLWINAGQITP